MEAPPAGVPRRRRCVQASKRRRLISQNSKPRTSPRPLLSVQPQRYRIWVGAFRWVPTFSATVSISACIRGRRVGLTSRFAVATHPARVIELDARTHRTYHYSDVSVPGIRPGQIYAYRAHGRFDPERGLRFDPTKALLDPYGRAVIVPDGYSRHTASRYRQNNAIAMKSVVVDPDVYDWEGDAPLRRPFATTVICEMQVGGFTRHPSSGIAPGRRGTYAGMIEKIPYLQDLGITTAELPPVFQFDCQDCPLGLVNY